MPKVFISYSWSSSEHQLLVKQWADQLISDGIEVILDIYDLKEGDDKFAFMESMVTDSTVTHVLVICDKEYSDKANARKAGVGTESQIISEEVYNKVKQSKFIPIVCEFDKDGNAYLPIFFKSRIWINFSTSESANENWEQLIRLLYGKPLHKKPKLGKTPSFILDNNTPPSPAVSKFNLFKEAILKNKPNVNICRKDFLNSCIEFADSLRVRTRPEVNSLGEKVLNDCSQLKQVRNHIIDWLLLETTIKQDINEFSDILISFLEDLRELKSRPAELNSWNDSWFEAHTFFVYETFLYIIASLLKTKSYQVLHEVFSTHYLVPESERYNRRDFDTFGCFYGYSNSLQNVLAEEGYRLHSPSAELIKRQADRNDIPHSSIIEAELLVLLMAILTPKTRWYPGTLHYVDHHRGFPFFIRAIQHKGFKNLSIITGISEVKTLKDLVSKGYERLGINQWHNFDFINFGELMNIEKLDTIK